MTSHFSVPLLFFRFFSVLFRLHTIELLNIDSFESRLHRSCLDLRTNVIEGSQNEVKRRRVSRAGYVVYDQTVTVKFPLLWNLLFSFLFFRFVLFVKRSTLSEFSFTALYVSPIIAVYVLSKYYFSVFYKQIMFLFFPLFSFLHTNQQIDKHDLCNQGISNYY